MIQPQPKPPPTPEPLPEQPEPAELEWWTRAHTERPPRQQMRLQFSPCDLVRLRCRTILFF